MSRKNKSIIWLLIFILLITVFVGAGTYAYLNIKIYNTGNFEVHLESKGVDTLTTKGREDISIEANVNNFSVLFGHDLVAETDLTVQLDTTKKDASYDYILEVRLPNEEIFTYSKPNTPELLLNVSKSIDGGKYEPIIVNKDITTETGTINVPVSIDSSDYIQNISTTKRKTKEEKWKVSITLVWFNDADQTINDNKKYDVQVKASVLRDEIK